MFKYLRGDLLIFTNRGLIRIDNINKNDLILTLDNNGNYYYEEIDELNKIYKKNYSLNKINFVNSIETYFLNDNINIKTIKNIPLNIDIEEIPNYLSYNNNCICNSTIKDLSNFDFIGFPTNFNSNNNNENFNDDYFRFQGLLISTSNFSTFNFNKELHKDTINFIINYLNTNNIQYNIINKNSYITFDTNNFIFPKISISTIINTTKDKLLAFITGLTEITNKLIINNKNDYNLIKFSYLLLGVSISSYLNDDKISIKLPKIIKNYYYNYFNYNNLLWNKIKSIKKINNFNGYLFSIKLKSNNYFLTNIGLIS